MKNETLLKISENRNSTYSYLKERKVKQNKNEMLQMKNKCI